VNHSVTGFTDPIMVKPNPPS